jgi:hypothetical protein
MASFSIISETYASRAGIDRSSAEATIWEVGLIRPSHLPNQLDDRRVPRDFGPRGVSTSVLANCRQVRIAIHEFASRSNKTWLIGPDKCPAGHATVFGDGTNAEKGRSGRSIGVYDLESKMEIPGKSRRYRWKES